MALRLTRYQGPGPCPVKSGIKLRLLRAYDQSTTGCLKKIIYIMTALASNTIQPIMNFLLAMCIQIIFLYILKTNVSLGVHNLVKPCRPTGNCENLTRCT